MLINKNLLIISFFPIFLKTTLAFDNQIAHFIENVTPSLPTTHSIYKHLHAHCTSDFECGRNTICEGSPPPQPHSQLPPPPPISKCRCKLGFLPATNKIDCEQVYCPTNATCHAHFGPRTKCVQSNTLGNYCTCASQRYLKLDENSQTCVPVRCGGRNSHGSCSDGMFCYYGKCHCKLGYTPLPNGFQCQLEHCKEDSECFKFDYNARCLGFKDLGNLGVCKCDTGFYLDRRSHLCTPNLESSTTTRNVLLIVGSFIFLIPLVICFIRTCQRRRKAIQDAERVEIVDGETQLPVPPPSRNTISSIISPVNNALSRHRIIAALNRLRGEGHGQRGQQGQQSQIIQPTLVVPGTNKSPDLPPIYDNVPSESAECTVVEVVTPPPPEYNNVLHR